MLKRFPSFKNRFLIRDSNQTAMNLMIVALIIPFFISTIKNSAILLKPLNLSGTIGTIVNLLDINQYTLSNGIQIFSYAISLRLIIFILPIALITFIELRKNSFEDTSIGRINNSVGYKYADIWYLEVLPLDGKEVSGFRF